MATIEAPIGSTGAKLVTEGYNSKVFLADGTQVSFTVKPDGTATVRNEISYQKEQAAILLNLVYSFIPSIASNLFNLWKYFFLSS